MQGKSGLFQGEWVVYDKMGGGIRKVGDGEIISRKPKEAESNRRVQLIRSPDE